MRINLALAAATLVLAASAQGAIMFDFGPAGATANPTNSPAHVTGAVPMAETTWNRVTLTNLTSVSNSNGSAAPGVSLTYGIAAASLTDVSYSQSPGSTITGGGVGIYAVNSPIKTGVFNASLTSLLGLRIDGLAAGDYEVFTTARNTASPTAGLTSRVYYATGVQASIFATASASSLDQANSQAVTLVGGNDSFVQGNQYQKFTVSVTGDNPALYLAFRGVTGETRPFLNSVEIVAVPEPGALAVLALAGIPFVAGRRTRRLVKSR